MTVELVGPIRHGHLEPAKIEAEVVRLRNECAALLGELESRVQRTLHIPRRIKEETIRLERAAVHWVRQHATLLVSVAAVAGGLALIGGLTAWGRSRRVERRTFSMRRVRRELRSLFDWW